MSPLLGLKKLSTTHRVSAMKSCKVVFKRDSIASVKNPLQQILKRSSQPNSTKTSFSKQKKTYCNGAFSTHRLQAFTIDSYWLWMDCGNLRAARRTLSSDPTPGPSLGPSCSPSRAARRVARQSCPARAWYTWITCYHTRKKSSTFVKINLDTLFSAESWHVALKV